MTGWLIAVVVAVGAEVGAAGLASPAATGQRTEPPPVLFDWRRAEAGVASGIALVEAGDFEAAVEVLEAAVRLLDADAPDRAAQARVQLYLGYARLYVDGEAAARRHALAARRYAPDVVPSADRFPRRFIRLWQTPAPAPPAARAAGRRGASSPDADAVAPVRQRSREAGRLGFFAVRAAPSGRCRGDLDVDPDRAVLEWRSADGRAACAGTEVVPFADVVSIGAAVGGGVIVRYGDDGSRRFIAPTPTGDGATPLRAPGRQGEAEAFWSGWRPQPAEVVVATRGLVRDLLAALGRPSFGPWSHYGMPLETSVTALLDTPAAFVGRPVRVSGRFSARADGYRLWADGAEVGLAPLPERQALVAANAGDLDGGVVTATGLFRRQPLDPTATAAGDPSYSVAVWEVASSRLARIRGDARSLAEVMSAPPADRQVDVVGQFRGGNFFGDVPPSTRAGVHDWVLRDGPHAVWVTGVAPAGPGWTLDVWSRRDTSTWLRVTGRLEVEREVATLHATDVVPVPPAPGRTGAPTGMLGWPESAPDIQFTLPLPFEPVGRDGQFVVQFTKPMAPETFTGNILLRYADARPTSLDLGATAVRWFYVEDQRALHIDPGVPLESGRTVTILLRSGIADRSGRELETVRRLTWAVADD